MVHDGIHELTTEEEFHSAYPVLSQLRDLTLDEYLERLKRQRQQGYRLYGSYDNDTLVAIAGVAKRHNFYSGPHLFVYDLVTDESRQGEGFGTKLLKFIQERAHSDSCEYVALESGLWREQTHEFYESIGYQKFCYSFRRPIE